MVSSRRSPRRRLATGAAVFALVMTVGGCAGVRTDGYPTHTVGPRRDDKPFGDACAQLAAHGGRAGADTARTSALELIGRTPQLAAFAALIKTAKARDMFLSMENVTVFVPTDQAFAHLTAERRAALKDPVKAGDFIRSLIVPEDLTREDLSNRSYSTLQTGVSVSVTGAGGNFRVGGAQVVCGSVTTKDARLHLLNSLPGSGA